MNKQANVVLYPSLDALSEVLNKTGNTEIASQLLCGTYREPKIKSKKGNKVFVSYDKWDRSVQYSYPTLRHYKTEEDMKNEYGGSTYKENDRPFSKEHTTERSTASMSLSAWESE